MERNDMEIVRSVDRAARLLEALFIAPEGKRLAELSQEVSLHKTTVLRLLRTLVSLGLVQRDPRTDQYRFEPLRWIAIGSFMRETLERTDLIQRVLDNLVEATNSTVVVVVPDFERRHAILAISSEPRTPVRLEAGDLPRVPIHTTAPGKVLLAHLPDDALQRILDQPLPKVTKYTIDNPEVLRREIETIRERGYAISSQEQVLGVSGLGAAILDHRGWAVGAVGIAALKDRLSEQQISEWVPLLLRARDQITNLLYAHAQHSSSAQKAAHRITGAQKESDDAQSETPAKKVYRMV